MRKAEDSKSKPGEWIDLLKDIDTGKNAIDGQWERAGRGVKVKFIQDSRNRLVMPLSPQGSYQLSVTFVVGSQGTRQAHLILPMGDTASTFNVAMNGHTNIVLKNDRVKLRDTILIPGKPVTTEVIVMVKNDQVEITATVDGEKLKPWKGALSEIGVNSYWALKDSQWLAIATYSSELTVLSARIRMLSGETKAVTVR